MLFKNPEAIIETVLMEMETHKTEWVTEDEEAESKQEFSEQIVEQARKRRTDPAFFFKLGQIFQRGFHVPKLNRPRFIVGEDRNTRLVVILTIGAAKLKMTSLIKLLGDIGTAKDSIARLNNELLKYAIKTTERSYMSPATWRYSQNLKDTELLYVPDSPELNTEAGRNIRFMRADDGGLISEYVTKDELSNELVTKTVSVPIKAILTTSNALTGDPAIESGMWTLRTSNDEQLTKVVKAEKLKFRAGKHKLFPENELQAWQCCFQLMMNEDVPEQAPTIPYAEDLMVLLGSEASKSRRDPDKICDLISTIAWMRRFQKPESLRSQADIIDLYIALRLAYDAIGETFEDLNRKELLIYYTVISNQDMDITCPYVSNETGIPYKTCYKYLEQMISKGFLLKEKKGRNNIYSSFKGKKLKTFLFQQDRNLDTPKGLMSFILDSVSMFSSSLQDTSTKNLTIIDPLTGAKIEVDVAKDPPQIIVEEKNYPYPYENKRTWERSQETVSKLKKKLDIILSSQKRTSQLVFPATYGVDSRDSRDSRDSSFPTLLGYGETQESLELVNRVLEEACESKPAHQVHFDELVKLTGLDDDVLKYNLGKLQLRGDACQPRPDIWKSLRKGGGE